VPKACYLLHHYEARMQRDRSLSYVFQFLLYLSLLSAFSVHASEDPLRPLQHLANQVYLSAQDMLIHGDEGHLHEIIEYGNNTIVLAEELLAALENADPKLLKGGKKQAIASVQGTLHMAKKAVAFSEENNKRLAVAAARKASFRAKQTRHSLQAIR